MKIAVSGISSLIDSNIFLRAFWSELRNRFGKCAWHYQPFKDGSSRTIFLGWADINKERLNLTMKKDHNIFMQELC